jgi:hypothetical protein
MTSRKIVSSVLAAAVVTLGLAATVVAQTPRQVPKPKVPPVRVFQADLAVTQIEAFDCLCFENLAKADAAMLGLVRVHLQNLSAATVDASVKLDYFDMNTGAWASRTSAVRLAKAGTPNTHPAVDFPLPYTLVRKSRPLQATISITTPHFTDNNAANNTKQYVIAACPTLVK